MIWSVATTTAVTVPTAPVAALPVSGIESAGARVPGEPVAALPVSALSVDGARVPGAPVAVTPVSDALLAEDAETLPTAPVAATPVSATTVAGARVPGAPVTVTPVSAADTPPPPLARSSPMNGNGAASPPWAAATESVPT